MEHDNKVFEGDVWVVDYGHLNLSTPPDGCMVTRKIYRVAADKVFYSTTGLSWDYTYVLFNKGKLIARCPRPSTALDLTELLNVLNKNGWVIVESEGVACDLVLRLRKGNP